MKIALPNMITTKYGGNSCLKEGIVEYNIWYRMTGKITMEY